MTRKQPGRRAIIKAAGSKIVIAKITVYDASFALEDINSLRALKIMIKN